MSFRAFKIPAGSSYLNVFQLNSKKEHVMIAVPEDNPIGQILLDIFNELKKADAKYLHDPMTHMKVGLKTIECEYKELEREVERATYEKPHWDWMRKEAVQVAAMAIKFMRDIICKAREEQ